jgi:hypothetical protein
MRTLREAWSTHTPENPFESCATAGTATQRAPRQAAIGNMVTVASGEFAGDGPTFLPVGDCGRYYY